jgi:hypothetical protein
LFVMLGVLLKIGGGSVNRGGKCFHGQSLA